LQRCFYRVQQFWQALTASIDEEDIQEVRAVLAPELLDLFLQMQTSEQAHSLWVYRRLRSQGETQPDLLAAALLHDVGKSLYPLKIWERVEIVLSKKFMPSVVKHWENSPSKGWRKPFVVAAQHPAWGAEMAQKAGATHRVVSLIRRHQDKVSLDQGKISTEEDHLLSLLQIYDDES